MVQFRKRCFCIIHQTVVTQADKINVFSQEHGAGLAKPNHNTVTHNKQKTSLSISTQPFAGFIS